MRLHVFVRSLVLVAATVLASACALPGATHEPRDPRTVPPPDPAEVSSRGGNLPLPLMLGHAGGTNMLIRQPDAILAKFFPDPAVVIPTPAFAQQEGFTSHAQMMVFIDELKARSSHLHVLNLGFSQQGRQIPILVFTTAGSGTAMALRTSGKPTVWIHAQLHGNEPASGEAALAIADEMSGPLAYLLDRINVVIIPRVNVDGAEHFERDAADGRDLNRDALRLDVSESLALRRASIAYMPAVTVDAHEYYATRSSLARLSGGPWLESHDLLLLGPENPNVPARLRAFTNDVFLAGIVRSAQAAGLTTHDYYTVRVSDAEESGGATRIDLVSGGSAARIGRNFHGLINQVSILLESRGIGIGRQSFGRRVFSQMVAMRSVLEDAWRDPAALTHVVDSARAEVIARGAITGDRDDLIIAAMRSIEKQYRVPFIDVITGTVRSFETTWHRFDPAVPTLVRQRPYAYLLPPEARAAILRLETFGVEFATIEHPRDVQVESWQVTSVRRDDALYEGVMRQSVDIVMHTRTVHVPAGTRIAYMAQPLANLIAECLEPEASDSFVRFGVLSAEPGEWLNVYRLMESATL